MAVSSAVDIELEIVSEVEQASGELVATRASGAPMAQGWRLIKSTYAVSNETTFVSQLVERQHSAKGVESEFEELLRAEERRGHGKGPSVKRASDEGTPGAPAGGGTGSRL
eukprot:4169587-Prymnesium_polylepis.1